MTRFQKILVILVRFQQVNVRFMKFLQNATQFFVNIFVINLLKIFQIMFILTKSIVFSTF